MSLFTKLGRKAERFKRSVTDAAEDPTECADCGTEFHADYDECPDCGREVAEE